MRPTIINNQQLVTKSLPKEKLLIYIQVDEIHTDEIHTDEIHVEKKSSYIRTLYKP